MEQSLVEKYLSLILANRPDITSETLQEMIAEKMKKVRIGDSYKTIYSIFLVAQELGVRLEHISLDQALKVAKIVPGMRGISIIGRVMGMSSRSVTTQAGDEVGLAKLYIGDETGWCTVILWRDKSELPELLSLHNGDIVQVQGGYSKEGLFNTTEIHVGNLGTLAKLQNFGQLPDMTSFFINPSTLPERPSIVNVSGLIGLVSDSRKFSGKRGESERRNIVIEDDTSQIPVVLWGKMAQRITENDTGKRVYIVGARTRVGITGNIELSLDDGGAIELGEKIESAKQFLTVHELEEGATVRLQCRVAKIFDEGVLNLTEIGTRRFREVIIYDESGTASLTIWERAIDAMPTLAEGDLVEIIGAKVRKAGMAASLSLGTYGSIKRIEQTRPSLLATQEIPVKLTRIKDIETEARNLWIEGVVLSSIRRQEITSRSGETIPKGDFNIADDTGLIRVTAWRDDVQKISGLTQNQPILVKWVDAKRDQFAGEIFLLVTRKTEIEKR